MLLNLNNFDPHVFLISLLVVILSITVHEFAHALAADRIGDDTPRRQGRLTLLPTEHFDPLGFLMIVFTSLGGIGMGWGKPVMVNPARFAHPRRDMIVIAAAGPFSNLILAIICGLLLRFLPVATLATDSGLPTLTYELLWAATRINLSLMFFNLIPITPLDGSKIISNMLPFEQSVRYDRMMGNYGPMLLLFLVFLGGSYILPELVGRPVQEGFRLITGF